LTRRGRLKIVDGAIVPPGFQIIQEKKKAAPSEGRRRPSEGNGLREINEIYVELP
jgi:hypothetical protein